MHQFIRISQDLWNSTIALICGACLLLAAGNGCVNRAPSIRMLDSRAGYGDAPDDDEVALYQRGKRAQDSVLKRASPRVAKVYVFPHELPTRDYFWGGYVSLLIAQDQWVFEASDEDAPPVAGIRETKSKRPHKYKKAAPVTHAPERDHSVKNLSISLATPLPKSIEAALANHETFARAFMERPESLANFLSYDEYVTDLGLFRQKDGSLGVVYEVALCEHETKTSQEIITLLEGLRSWFRLPEEVTLSLLFEQSIVSKFDREWDMLVTPTDRSRGDIPASLHLAQVERLRGSGVPMRRTLYISVRQFEQTPSAKARIGRAAAELGNPHATLSHELQAFLKRARAFNHSLSQFELTSPLALRRINATELTDYLRRTFNPVTYYQRPFAPVNPGLSLSEQVIFCPSRIDYPGITREGVTTRTISLKNAPSFAYPGAMAYFLGLDFPFRLCLNISFPKSGAVKRQFALKEFFLQNTPTARARRQKKEIDDIQDQLLRDDRVLNMTFTLMIEGNTQDELEQRTQECLARFQQRLECEALVEKEIGFGLWLNALPLQYHPIADYTAQRAVKILASDIVHFCPVLDTFRGCPMVAGGGSIFMSRENGIVPFSLRTHGNSHMTAVLGDTGSGKSGQVIRMLLGELRRDPKPLIFVIDHKTSYGMLSKFLPSELTVFEHGKPMPFSPFRGPLDEEKLGFLIKLLTAAIQLTSPTFAFDSEHTSCITQAIRQAYDVRTRTAGVRYVQGELLGADANALEAADVSIDDVISQLGTLTGQTDFEKYGQAVDDLAKKLRPFYSDGVYGPFFRGSQSAHGATPLADLYVYDLDALAGEPVLQTLMTMSVVDDIRRKVKDTDARSRGGFIVIEELGMLGRNNPVAKDFVIDAAETFRKLGFFLIGLTPNPRNYFDTSAGQAMWAVADHFIFLSMKDDNVNFIAKNSDLLNEAASQIVKSLRTERGLYADAFYVHKTQTLAGAFRSVPSAHELWLMPTHRPDALEAERTLALFPTEPLRALEDLVTRFPEGTTETGDSS
ncbi:hypothetical protein WDW86_03110 [Bdellovibrionota bacterium FG-2]